MVYVFEDGRLLYDSKLLKPEDEGKYVAVDELPIVKDMPPNSHVRYAVDMTTKQVHWTFIPVSPQEVDENGYPIEQPIEEVQ